MNDRRPISQFQRQWDRSEPKGWTVIGIRRPKEHESRRINQRVKRMIDQGFVEEVRSLLNEPKPMSRQARAAIGYAEMIDHLENKTTLDEAIEVIKINTRRLQSPADMVLKPRPYSLDRYGRTNLPKPSQQTLSLLKTAGRPSRMRAW